MTAYSFKAPTVESGATILVVIKTYLRVNKTAYRDTNRRDAIHRGHSLRGGPQKSKVQKCAATVTCKEWTSCRNYYLSRFATGAVHRCTTTTARALRPFGRTTTWHSGPMTRIFC